MTGAIKWALARVGLRVFRTRGLPAGLDVCVDLARMAGRAPVRTVADVGANVGQSVLLFQRLHPERIVSFEPVPAAFAELQRVCARAGNAVCENVALGAAPGTVTIEPAGATGQRSRVVADGGLTAVPVRVDTLDAAAARHGLDRIDLLKIDTEGYELTVLTGAAGLLATGRVRFVLAECSFVAGDQYHGYFPDLMAHLTPFGFRFAGLYDQSQRNDRLEFANALFALQTSEHT